MVPGRKKTAPLPAATARWSFLRAWPPQRPQSPQLTMKRGELNEGAARTPTMMPQETSHPPRPRRTRTSLRAMQGLTPVETSMLPSVAAPLLPPGRWLNGIARTMMMPQETHHTPHRTRTWMQGMQGLTTSGTSMLPSVVALGCAPGRRRASASCRMHTCRPQRRALDDEVVVVCLVCILARRHHFPSPPARLLPRLVTCSGRAPTR